MLFGCAAKASHRAEVCLVHPTIEVSLTLLRYFFTFGLEHVAILEFWEICGQNFLMCFWVMITFCCCRSDIHASNVGLVSMCYRDGNWILMMSQEQTVLCGFVIYWCRSTFSLNPFPWITCQMDKILFGQLLYTLFYGVTYPSCFLIFAKLFRLWIICYLVNRIKLHKSA
jgi:hypothetical protein